jgi:hypothetical protein
MLAVGVVVLHRMGMKVALDLGYPRFQSEKDLGPSLAKAFWISRPVVKIYIKACIEKTDMRS